MSPCEDASSCPILVHILYFNNTFTKKPHSGCGTQNIEGGSSQEGNPLVRGRWWPALGWKLREGEKLSKPGYMVKGGAQEAPGLDVREREGAAAEASRLGTRVDFSTI